MAQAEAARAAAEEEAAASEIGAVFWTDDVMSVKTEGNMSDDEWSVSDVATRRMSRDMTDAAQREYFAGVTLRSYNDEGTALNCKELWFADTFDTGHRVV